MQPKPSALALLALMATAGGLHAETAKLNYLPAFPGAEGAGAKATGGRGGRVIEVTNLNDNGPGSLREAIDAKGPRIVVFRVSGTIELKSRLNVNNGDITIAGQTAPGDGICLKNYSISIPSRNVIVRYIRSRLGDESAQQSDSMTVWRGAQNVIVDHCTASWSIDESLSLAGDVSDITVQWCMIGEALRASKHVKGPHGFGSLMRASGPVSLHHNLWMHNDSRNPRMGDTYGKAPFPTFDVRNNVIYDYGATATGLTQGNLKVNYVGNYIRSGPSSTAKFPIRIGENSDMTFFIQDNVFEGHDDMTADNTKFFERLEINGKRQVQFTDKPFEMEPVKTTPAQEAYEAVLNSAGCSLPARDAADARIVREVRERGGHMIDSQTQVGGWPELKSTPAPLDSDHDGMPDDWELKHGLNPQADNDGTHDYDRDGYTNVEEYLNGTDPNQAMDYKDPQNNVFPVSQPVAGLHPDIEYAQAGGQKLLLDAFNPGGAQPAPAAVILHGGGWGSGSKSGDITPVREALSQAGFSWFSINYRLAPANLWPACYEDVETALRWVKAHAAEYGADPKRIALIGYSAGGHLACRASVLASRDTQVQAVVGLAAPTDMVADTARRGGLSPSLQALLDMKPDDARVPASLVMLSPLNDIKPGLPPFLLIHGTVDQSVPFDQSIQFQKRLRKAGVSCDLIELKDAPHAIANWPQSDPEYLNKMVSWLRKTLQAPGGKTV